MTVRSFSPVCLLPQLQRCKYQLRIFAFQVFSCEEVPPSLPAYARGISHKTVLELATSTLSSAGISFGAIRVLGGDYLEKHNLMVERNYFLTSSQYLQLTNNLQQTTVSFLRLE